MSATEKLLDYLSMLPEDYKNLRQHVLKTIGGEVIFTGLINNSKLSVAELHIPAQGMTSDWHSHAEGESFILRKGSPYYIEIEGLKNCIKVTLEKVCYVPPKIRHRLAGTEGESKSIIVLVPGSDTFPRGRDGK